MDRHAYLILAHRNWNQLSILISLLDYKDNDIYIHIDKNSFFGEKERKQIKDSCKESQVVFVERRSVGWGDYSVVDAELLLLKTAVCKGYLYYHLISGMDLPLKTQREIHAFFQRNSGKEFIHYLDDVWKEKTSTRVQCYWPLQRVCASKRGKGIFFFLQRALVKIQIFLGVNRAKEYALQTGSQWFSITNELAKKLCANDKIIKKRFSRTFCCDEWVVQTMADELGFRQKCYHPGASSTKETILRYIDWEKGNPYIFRLEDLSDLLNSNCLFARKFDDTIDSQIIESVYLAVNKRDQDEQEDIIVGKDCGGINMLVVN